MFCKYSDSSSENGSVFVEFDVNYIRSRKSCDINMSPSHGVASGDLLYLATISRWLRGRRRVVGILLLFSLFSFLFLFLGLSPAPSMVSPVSWHIYERYCNLPAFRRFVSGVLGKRNPPTGVDGTTCSLGLATSVIIRKSVQCSPGKV